MNASPDDNRTITLSELMPPEKANFGGNIHGGYLLSLLDRVAYACAAQYAGCYVVTLSVNRVVFKQPIRVGEMVTCCASVNHVGRSSMEVGVKVTAKNLITKENRHTNSCYFTMIALDENQKPVAVKPLTLNTARQKRRFKEAELRKKLAATYYEQSKQYKEQLRKSLHESEQDSDQD